MAKQLEVKTGDIVKVVIEVRKAEEAPTIYNFYQGEIVEIIADKENCYYVRIAELDRLIPINIMSSLWKEKGLRSNELLNPLISLLRFTRCLS